MLLLTKKIKGDMGLVMTGLPGAMAGAVKITLGAMDKARATGGSPGTHILQQIRDQLDLPACPAVIRYRRKAGCYIWKTGSSYRLCSQRVIH